MSPNPCPLCQRTDYSVVGSVDGRDASVIQCPRCGTYAIDAMAPMTIDHRFSDQRFRLTAATRAASDAGQRAFVDASTIEQLISTVRPPGTLFEMVDRAMLLMADRAPTYWAPVRVNTQTDYPLIVARGPDEFDYFLQIATEMRWLEPGSGRVTVSGWQRVEQLRALRPSSRQALVAMWFDPSLNDAWIDGFKAGIEDTTLFDAVRIDRVEHNDKIDDRIIAEIRKSGLVVADFTGNRGGVYFEAGFALGLGIPVIWCCRDDSLTDVHFDTRQYNHIVWSLPADLRTRLRDRIAATIARKSGAPLTST